MNAATETLTPRIEPLLAAAHGDHDTLRERRAALVRSGIGRDQLPDDLALMAFALLGDHERDERLAELRPHWSALQSKGLVSGPIDASATPILRLLANIREQTEAIGPIWQQLREAVDAPEPPNGAWRSAARVRGLWGQQAQLHFSVRDVEHLLIDPDPVFGLQSALLAVDSNVSHSGSFPFPIDNGMITIRLRHRNGEVYRHVVEVMVEELA